MEAVELRTNRYRVTWVIDIEAATPSAAAIKALVIQRDPDSIATVFTVSSDCGEEPVHIDVLEVPEFWTPE